MDNKTTQVKFVCSRISLQGGTQELVFTTFFPGFACLLITLLIFVCHFEKYMRHILHQCIAGANHEVRPSGEAPAIH